MVDDESKISGSDGLSGEIYRDIKRVGGRLANGIARPFKRYLDERTALAAFHPEFRSHGRGVTALVDYVKWHESDKDWREGNGLLCAATYGELPHFWTRVERFARYEARLFRFLRSGGEVRRVFVIAHELAYDSTRFLLYRTLRRHLALRFAPRVLGVIDLEDAAAAMGVHTNMIGCLNSRIAYFFQCHDDGYPTMVRTEEPVITYKAQRVFERLWKKSSSATDFFHRHHFEVPEEIEQQVRRDIETVEEIASEHRNA